MVHRHVYYLNSFSLENPDMNILLFSGRQLNLWTCGILLHLNLQTCFYLSHFNNIFLTLKPAFISLKIIHSQLYKYSSTTTTLPNIHLGRKWIIFTNFHFSFDSLRCFSMNLCITSCLSSLADCLESERVAYDQDGYIRE